MSHEQQLLHPLDHTLPQQSEVPLQQPNPHAERVHYPAVDTINRDANPQRGLGTDVMGDPVNPSFNYAHATSGHTGASANSAQYVDRPVASSNQPSNYGSQGGYPSNLPGNHRPQEVNLSNQPVNSSYVQIDSAPVNTGKTPMDSIMEVLNKWGKKAEDLTGNVWNHLQTGPNVAETAWGRLTVGTKAISEGGLEKVFRQTFEVSPNEQLLKTYACYLSTSTGPVAGTLYISSERLAFCSDRPLSASHATPNTNNATAGSNATATGGHHQQSWCYYKVVVPVTKLQAVNPSENTQKRPPEKYVQVQTVDGHDFWFMGFVHYDKGVKNLQETLQKSRDGNAHPAPTPTPTPPTTTTPVTTAPPATTPLL